MAGYIDDIVKATQKSEAFRRELFTAAHSQLVAMSLEPLEEIGMEVHPDVDQLLRVEAGEGEATLGDRKHTLHTGSVVIVPAGVSHNVVNTSKTLELKLSTVYSPPEHRAGTLHKTKEEAVAAEAAEHQHGSKREAWGRWSQRSLPAPMQTPSSVDSASVGKQIAAREPWTKLGAAGTFRASVFGVSDGLASNLLLVLGFVGAQASPGTIQLAGISGLLAGASSMAVGEYVSMRAQSELYQRQISLEAAELDARPHEEELEIAEIFKAKGLSADEAARVASELMVDRKVALETLIREELGLNPNELGSPWGAAIGSFISFAVGALVPVLPYIVHPSGGIVTFAASFALAAASVFGVGAALSTFTGRNPLFSGARQLVLVGAAAAVTFGIGRLLGFVTRG